MAYFTQKVAGPVDRMSKVVLGVRKPTDAYFEAMSTCPVASVVKGIDRVHHHGSMLGAFSPAKMASYLEKTDTDILPMLQKTRRRFS